MRKIILILFIFVMTVYAEKKELPEQASDKAKERKAGSPSQKKTNFDIEAYKAYEEALMNPRKEEIVAKNLKIEKIFGDEGEYFKLFDKNTDKIIGEYEDVRVYISEDRNYTFILPDSFYEPLESANVVLFDNINLKIIWKKEVKWFKERYGRYKAGTAGISKHGEMVGIVLSPEKFLESPIHDIIVLNRKGKVVVEMQYGPHFLGGENDTLEFSPKLKLMIGKEKREGEITYIVFSIKAEEFICKSRLISVSSDEEYLAALRQFPDFEREEFRRALVNRELEKEYYRIMGVSEDRLSMKSPFIDLENFIEPYVDIYEIESGRKIGNIRVPIKGYVREWKRLKGGSMAISPVKEIKFSKDGSKIIITTEYKGKRKGQVFTVKGAKEFLEKQRRDFEKLSEKNRVKIEEKKIPWQEKGSD